MRIQTTVERVGVYLLLSIAAVLFIYPILLVFMSAVKSTEEFMANPIGLPMQFTLENFVNVWREGHVVRLFGNSVTVALFAVGGTVLLGAMVAFGLLRKFRASGLLVFYFLLGMMVPSQVTAIATFIFLKKIHLLGSYTGLVLIYISHLISIAVFLLHGFFKNTPKELEEAAELDGCSDWRMFWSIVIPISRPILATVIILTGMWTWNDFFLPLVLILDQEKFTLPLGLLRLKGEYTVNWPQLFSTIAINITPIIVLFLFMQKQFIEGLTSGSVKG